MDLITGSFSKSLASTGGFVAGSKGLIEYLRSNSRQIIFSAAISPPSAAAARAALDVMKTEHNSEHLWTNYHRLRGIIEEIGLDYWESPTPALPIVIGDKEKCYLLWKALWDAGFLP